MRGNVDTPGTMTARLRCAGSGCAKQHATQFLTGEKLKLDGTINFKIMVKRRSLFQAKLIGL
jgi:hypothetical protein